VRNGEALFQHYCFTCHGDVAVSGGCPPRPPLFPAHSKTINGFEIVSERPSLKQGRQWFSFDKETLA